MRGTISESVSGVWLAVVTCDPSECICATAFCCVRVKLQGWVLHLEWGRVQGLSLPPGVRSFCVSTVAAEGECVCETEGPGPDLNLCGEHECVCVCVCSCAAFSWGCSDHSLRHCVLASVSTHEAGENGSMSLQSEPHLGNHWARSRSGGPGKVRAEWVGGGGRELKPGRKRGH